MSDISELTNQFWPTPESANRPWTRWWWLGSAVTRQTITQLLEQYRDAGLGGVEITSVYGVNDESANSVEYLSDEWLSLVSHTIHEANRLGLGVDLPPGSGWRIGGRFVDESIAAARLKIEKPSETSQYRVWCQPTGERVKRPGPGGEGLAFNPLNAEATRRFIDFFKPVFETLPVRAQFHDSWEYSSSASQDLLDEFKRRYGYDIEHIAAALAGDAGVDQQQRAYHDVRQVIADLVLNEFITPWTDFCHAMGQQSRNQSHGSPANVIDLYAAVDIPETEVFGPVVPDAPLMSKLASSAAHLSGKRLVSSETGTWTEEHFCVTLSDLKNVLDHLFVAGINHHVYHGTAYSPPDVPWPGWLFYASTQLNPQNPWWRDVSFLNDYVTRCQSILQRAMPDDDLLVYLPVHEAYGDTSRSLHSGLSIEGQWFKPLAAAPIIRDLWNAGYCFDYVSDTQISELQVVDGELTTGHARYAAVVVPPMTTLPLQTLEHLHRITQSGGHVIFRTPLPHGVPGLWKLVEQNERFRKLIADHPATDDLDDALGKAGVWREGWCRDSSLRCIRKKLDGRSVYFIFNPSSESRDLNLPLRSLGDASSDWLIQCPMTGTVGQAARNAQGVRVQLQAGETCFVIERPDAADLAEPWAYQDAQGVAVNIEGVWRVDFIEGGPSLPPTFECKTLESWTKRGNEYESFAGTARYSIKFEVPGEGWICWLDLGEVNSTARVVLNGEHVATLIGPTFVTPLRNVLTGENRLEIEVTNVAANRIRDLDRRGVEWQIFEDINFVNRDYKDFDASDWELKPSGLLGPVRLLRSD